MTRDIRLKIEALYNAGLNPNQIAKQIGFHNSSVYREIKRSLYDHLDGQTWKTHKRYSADIGEQKALFLRSSQGRLAKIGNDHAFVKYIETQILKHKKSPYAILSTIQKEHIHFNTQICLSTLYNYIRKGYFLHVTMKDLWKPRKHRKHKPTMRKAPLQGNSIEDRPQTANDRFFGHWELDSIIGKKEKGQTLLTFVERSTRYTLIFRSEAKTKEATETVLNNLKMHLQKYYAQIFKTITTDNGTEFRLNLPNQYYCHPYSSWERGSNENINGFIRRFIPKGTKIETVTDEQLSAIQTFINTYPRRIFGGKSALDQLKNALFIEEIPFPQKFF